MNLSKIGKSIVNIITGNNILEVCSAFISRFDLTTKNVKIIENRPSVNTLMEISRTEKCNSGRRTISKPCLIVDIMRMKKNV